MTSTPFQVKFHYARPLVTFDWQFLFLGTLTATSPTRPGNFEQQLNSLPNPADYNVIWLDEDTAMEYDCFKNLFVEEYCVHFMSRTPTIQPNKLETMIKFASKFISISIFFVINIFLQKASFILILISPFRWDIGTQSRPTTVRTDPAGRMLDR